MKTWKHNIHKIMMFEKFICIKVMFKNIAKVERNKILKN